jgi:hypothetical protein
MIRFRDALNRHRIHLASLIIAGMMIGCEGGSSSTPTPTDTAPNAGKRNKDMQDFMDKEKKAAKGAHK